MALGSSMEGNDHPDGESFTPTLIGLFRASAAFTGLEFLKSTVVKLTNVLGVRAVYVSELLPSRQRARIIAASGLLDAQEGQEHLIDYGLVHEDLKVARESGLASDDLPGLSPSHTYVAAPLKSRSQDIIGLLVVVYESNYGRTDFASSLLTELTPHLSAHLEKFQRDREASRNESRLRLQYQYSRDILFYYLGKQGRFEFVSPVVEAITGYPQEAFLADPRLSEKIVRVDDLARLKTLITSGNEDPVVARITRADGSEAWLEITCHVFRDDEGSIIACCGEARDFTKTANTLDGLRRSEQYKDALLRSCPDTLFRLDSLGKILDFIPGEEIEGIDTESPMVGRNIRQALPTALAAPVAQLVRLVNESGQTRRAEFEIASEGQTKVFETWVAPIDASEVVFCLRDVTSMKWHHGERDSRALRDEVDAKEEKARANPYQLTYRELAILRLVAEGQADKQIAESLGISTYTVNKHVCNILGKMDASSRTEACVRGLREGLVG